MHQREEAGHGWNTDCIGGDGRLRQVHPVRPAVRPPAAAGGGLSASEISPVRAGVLGYAASAFYAVDRYASYKKVWGDWYEGGGLVLADRYTTSNAIHQASKVPPEEREAFFRWLYDFEYGKLGLPRPDLVLYLDVPTEYTVGMLRSREEQTSTQADIHEQDTAYLRTCRESGAQAAQVLGWRRVQCVRDGAMRSIEDIHGEIWAQVEPLLK